MSRSLVLAALAAALTVSIPARAEGRRPMTPKDVVELKQVSDPQISPDGSRVAFVVT